MRPGITASSTRSSSITRAFRATAPGSVGQAGRRRVPWVRALPWAVLFAVVFGWVLPPGGSAAAQGRADGSGFRLASSAVAPADAVPDSVRPVRLTYRFRARRAIGIAIRVIRAGTGRTVRRFTFGSRRPGRWHRQAWNGLTRKGKPVGAGRYRVAVGPKGGPLRTLGNLRLHRYAFPVAAPHGVRGAVGLFGASRTGGRTHEGFDVTAACGSPLVAIRAGRILKVAYDDRYLGNHVVLKGKGERRTYLYAHLPRPATVRTGQTVRAGHRLGAVGQTGNAGGTPCHLHIEVRSRGRLLDPWPYLSHADW